MGDRPKSVLAFVEIPRGSRNKYEFDPVHGGIRLDRVLYSPLHYPADYGFVKDTLAEDGDHLDVLIFTYEPTFPGCLVEVRPIGMLDMRDEKGIDQKILAVPVGDPRFEGVTGGGSRKAPTPVEGRGADRSLPVEAETWWSSRLHPKGRCKEPTRPGRVVRRSALPSDR